MSDKNVAQLAQYSWVKEFNPDWIYKTDRRETIADLRDDFSLIELHEAYTCGFLAGVAYFVTKEIPE